MAAKHRVDFFLVLVVGFVSVLGCNSEKQDQTAEPSNGRAEVPLDARNTVSAQDSFKALPAVASEPKEPEVPSRAETAWNRSLPGHTELLTFAKGGGYTSSLVFSPNGTKLAVSGDKGAAVFDATNGKLLRVCKGHNDAVLGVAFSPDGARLASASLDTTAKVFDLANGSELLTLVGHTDFVNGVAFNRDGTRLATASDDRSVKIWDATTGELIHTLLGHQRSVEYVMFSPVDDLLVSTSRFEESFRIWDSSSAKEIRVLNGHNEGTPIAQYSSDGKQIVSAGSDGTSKVWDVSTGELLYTLQRDSAPVVFAVFNPARTRIATCSSPRTIRIWDTTSHEALLEIQPPVADTSDYLNVVAFSPEGWRLAAGGFCPTVLWDARPAGMERPEQIIVMNEAKAEAEAVRKDFANGILRVPFTPSDGQAAQSVWKERFGLDPQTTDTNGIELILIPPGRFEMGSSANEFNRDPSEILHPVELSEPYYLGVTEITREQWYSVMQTEPWKGEPKEFIDGTVAVSSMSWYDAVKFCNQLSEKLKLPRYYEIQGDRVTILGGKGYRLPTEAEWEYACRAGTNSPYSFGNASEPMNEYAWYAASYVPFEFSRGKDNIIVPGLTSGGQMVQQVRSLKPNPWGLFDMHGNVMEWCWDIPRDYSEDLVKDPLGQDPANQTESDRVIRGGSFALDYYYCRSAARGDLGPRFSTSHVGFRVARSPLDERNKD